MHRKWMLSLFLAITLLVLKSCKNPKQERIVVTNDTAFEKGSYGYDRAFLKKNNHDFIELFNIDGNSKLLISSEFQGRVMTSSATGDSGLSLGWLNYKLLSDAEKNSQFNPVGGEERFWMGPEGGQFSIYFPRQDSFLFKNWKVPAFLDTEPFNIISRDSNSVTLGRDVVFSNYAGTQFNIGISRNVELLEEQELISALTFSIPKGISFIAYKTRNEIINKGAEDWNKKAGLLSVWLLGMFTPSPQTIVMIPFKPGRNAGARITSSYFGTIPPDRLVIQDSALFFYCDGEYRSKIGIDPSIAKPVAAAFDFSNNIFTVVIPEIHSNASYVNSKWEHQKNPFRGDVINAYNDGPLADGTKMGPFFEIESSSPALELKRNETGAYSQVTCHFQGDFEALQKLALQLTGIDPETMKNTMQNSGKASKLVLR